MVQDIAAQLPQNVEFVLLNQGEAKATLLHVMEKTYLPVKMVIDNCESGQYCEYVGAKLYQQPDASGVIYPGRWFPFSRAYVIKVNGTSPPNTSLEVTSMLTGYDPRVVLCRIEDALTE
jgi:hypothetical protein